MIIGGSGLFGCNFAQSVLEPQSCILFISTCKADIYAHTHCASDCNTALMLGYHFLVVSLGKCVGMISVLMYWTCHSVVLRHF